MSGRDASDSAPGGCSASQLEAAAGDAAGLRDVGGEAGEATGSILDLLDSLPEFKQRRELALSRPDRARDKLKAYAVVDLKIVKARGLLVADWQSSDPYVEVCVDDVVKAQTGVVCVNLNPEWNWQGSIPVKSPRSMLLLRLLDWDLGQEPDALGFVEFPVRYLPLDTCVRGWFAVSPPEELAGAAPARFLRSSERPPTRECGAVYLEATRRIVSGDPSDELYAWCLPPPVHFEYPEVGWMSPQTLDAQALVDNVMEFKARLLCGVIRPVMLSVGCALSWRDPLLSLVILGTSLGIALCPRLLLTGLFGALGVFLLMLIDPARRSALLAHPAVVPLNAEGYRLMAAMSDTDKMVTFLQRIAVSLQATVVDTDRFREFAAFASHESLPTTTYVGLKEQLLAASKARGPQNELPFISFKGYPMPEGTRVKSRQGEFGEVVRCTNPSEVLCWRYEVRFGGSGDRAEVRRVLADDLEVRIDASWLAGPVVAALVPQSMTTSLNCWCRSFKGWSASIQGITRPMEEVFSWSDRTKSAGIAVGCLVLSVAFIWLQRLFFVVVSAILFARTTQAWVSHFAWRGALAQHSKTEPLDLKTCPFYLGCEPDDASDEGWRASLSHGFGAALPGLGAARRSPAASPPRSPRPAAGGDAAGEAAGPHFEAAGVEAATAADSPAEVAWPWWWGCFHRPAASLGESGAEPPWAPPPLSARRDGEKAD